MNYFISLLIGGIISIMVLFNGTLSENIGILGSTILIHIVGLISILLVLLFTKTKFKLQQGIPIYLYSAGLIGVGTVVFTNISYSKLGISLPLALGLLGQMLFSIFADHFGFMGTKVIKFNPKKSVGLLLMTVGIIIMAMF